MYLLDYFVGFIFIFVFFSILFIGARFFPKNRIFNYCLILLNKKFQAKIIIGNAKEESARFFLDIKVKNFLKKISFNQSKEQTVAIVKSKESKSLRLKIGIIYIFLAMINILFFSVMIFDNQTGLLVKNFKFQAENFASTVITDLGSKRISKNDDANLKNLKENLIYHQIYQFRVFSITGEVWYNEKGIVVGEIIEEDLLRKAKEISDTISVFSSKYKLELNKEDFSIKFLIPVSAEPESDGPIFLITQLSLRGFQDQLSQMYYQIGIIFVWIVISQVLFGMYIFRLIFKRITILRDATGKMGEEDLKSRALWKYNRNDELDDLGNSFNSMADSLETKIQTISSLHENIHKEVLVGKTIQGVLIPANEISLDWLDVYGISKSSTELGGDYFKIFTRQSRKNEIQIALGDVSGHGVGSALIVSSVIAITNQEATLESKDTSKIIANVNKQMASLFSFERKSKIKYFTTSLFCNVRKRGDVIRLFYTNAGHLSPLIIRNRKCTEINSAKHGLALGVYAKAKYFEEIFELKKDDVIILYTDGLIEQENSNGIQFGINRLIESLSNFQLQNSKSISEYILNKVQEFSGGLANNDDITLVVLKVLHSVKNRKLSLPAIKIKRVKSRAKKN
ncbi:MAG: SpoIIE family protein phosphatase [Leptospiraceae bacterium]|nr:SpoIIE family protein phosphatase [Leptospiraceae bacterium]